MNWNSIQQNWNALRGCATSHWSGCDNEREHRDLEQYLRERCGVPRDEARRQRRDWIKDPGVLDDWNDTRSILDM